VAVLANRLDRLDTHALDWQRVRVATVGLSHADLVRSAESSAKLPFWPTDSISTDDLESALRDRHQADD